MQPSDEIKQKLDIVDFIRDYIPLKAAGMNFRARCPFHREKTIVDFGAVLIVGDVTKTVESVLLVDWIFEYDQHLAIVTEIGLVFKIGVNVGHNQEDIVIREYVELCHRIRAVAG